jgi:hypothetical protein
MPEAEKSARRTWVVGADAKQEEIERALEHERREMRRARWLGFAIGLAAAVVVLAAVFMLQHRRGVVR